METNNNAVERFSWKNAIADLGQVKVNHQEIKSEAQEDLSWESILKKDELKVWEIKDLKMRLLPDSEHGTFYTDRAYIILNTHYKKFIPEPTYRIHTWLSKYTSEEDYKLSVKKIQLLDTFLEDHSRFIHREIRLTESDLFHSYFSQIEVLRGGVPGDQRLLQFHVEETAHTVFTSQKQKKKWMVEKKFLRGNLKSDDVFVLTDLNNRAVYQWNGIESNQDERTWAKKYIDQLKAKLPYKIDVHQVADGLRNKDHKLYTLFPSGGIKKKERKTSIMSTQKVKRLYRMSPEGKLLGRAIEIPKVCKSSLDHDHVYLLDTEHHLYAWIGDGMDFADKHKALLQAEEFLKCEYLEDKRADKFHQVCNKPITLVPDGTSYMDFDRAFQG